MANPQVENGHTRISNELLEAFIKYRFPPNTDSPRILWLFIARKTYGYSKKADFIPLSQFEKGTNLPRNTIVHWLDYMVKGLLLVKGLELGKNGYTYGINKNYDSWKPLVKGLKLVKGRSFTSERALTKTGKRALTLNNKKQYIINKDFSEFDFLADTAFKELWDSYLKMRKLIKKPASEKAQELALKQLHAENIETAKGMLEQSILNSWQGIFPLKNKTQKQDNEMERYAKEMVAKYGEEQAMFKFKEKYSTDDILKVSYVFGL